MKSKNEFIADSVTMLKLVEQIDCGDIPSNEEIAKAISSLSQKTINEIEDAVIKQGLAPYLPRSWNPGSPEFLEAMGRLKELSNEGGNDKNPPEGWFDAWAEMMRTAPRWWKAEIENIAEETIEMPTADYCTEDGQPLYSIENVSKHLGISEDEILRAFEGVENDGYFITPETPSFRVN